MSASRNPLRRGVGIAVGTIVILVVGLYGPATLVGPLPAAHTSITTPDAAPPTSEAQASTSQASAPALPTAGASAISVAADRPPVATAGDSDAVPLAGIAKIVTALVVLDAKPISSGRSGPVITMTSQDAALYATDKAAGAVTVPVVAGEPWTEKQMLQAMLLASSNNHAGSLARWAFGSEEAYLAAASAWLGEHSLTHTHVADASGLSDASVGTAADAARLAALAMADATIADIVANPVDMVVNRVIDNSTVFHPELGVTGLSRSYTDAAGVCFLFSASVTIDGEPFRFTGAFLRMPDWDTLENALAALMTDAKTSVHRIAVVKKGARFASIDTPWGEKAHAVADSAVTVTGWNTLKPTFSVTVKRLTTAPRDRTVGELHVKLGGVTDTVALVLDASLNDPGPLWRVLNPVPVISSFVESLSR